MNASRSLSFHVSITLPGRGGGFATLNAFWGAFFVSSSLPFLNAVTDNYSNSAPCVIMKNWKYPKCLPKEN